MSVQGVAVVNKLLKAYISNYGTSGQKLEAPYPNMLRHEDQRTVETFNK